MNTLYTATVISFLLGLAAIIPLLLSLRGRWKARGYALGYDAAHSSQQRLLDANAERIRAQWAQEFYRQPTTEETPA